MPRKYLAFDIESALDVIRRSDAGVETSPPFGNHLRCRSSQRQRKPSRLGRAKWAMAATTG
jgi:hypothetical protein